MSLAPALDPRIRGVEGKSRPVERTCCVPGCISLSQQAHHMWARSYLRGQPTEWVSLPSGRIVSNTIGMCMRHHADVTGGPGGHKGMIHLEADEHFAYLIPVESEHGPGWEHQGLLHPQPWSETPVESVPDVAVRPSAAHAHPNLEPGQTCDSCGYTRPVKRAQGHKRGSKTYALIVPDDSEIGADILDEWVEQFAVVLGFGDDVSQRLVRYHTFVAVFAWAMQNRQQFIEDLQEAMAS